MFKKCHYILIHVPNVRFQLLCVTQEIQADLPQDIAAQASMPENDATPVDIRRQKSLQLKSMSAPSSAERERSRLHKHLLHGWDAGLDEKRTTLQSKDRSQCGLVKSQLLLRSSL